MIIKDIKPIKDKYEITFDNYEKLLVSEDILVKFNLTVNKELYDLLEINEEIKLEAIYNKAARYASYGKTSFQLKEYLIKQGVNDYEYIIDKLKKNHYLNDSLIIDNLLNKNYSVLKLTKKLNYYLSDEILINDILSNYDEDKALDYNYNYAISKYNNPTKVYQYLLRLGFPSDKLNSKFNIF